MKSQKKIKRVFIHLLTCLIPIKQSRRAIRQFLYFSFLDNNFSIVEAYKNIVFRPEIYKNTPPSFSMPSFEHPLVSIIIPVFNQYSFTKLCLWSILQQTHDIPYEIILADDCSTDQTTEILNEIKHITVIRTNSNIGFLHNCNNAAKYAIGTYILFLNNDTQVQQNWLQPLLDVMHKDITVGLVGSKLIYPDGRLQEAGGIIWKNAQGYNYGRNQKANSSCYNYVKETDYISGASIMLRNLLWKELSGFDARYAPAYYEDTDIAFRIRYQKKLKVVYQPLSTVVHFEGKSNGTDITSGIKSCQIENAKQFQERWREELALSHCDEVDIFFARDRSYKKKTLLVIDEFVPTFDRDAGSRATLQYLLFFIENGFNVKFLSLENQGKFYYREILQQMGVELVLPDYSQDRGIEWIKKNGKYIDYIYI